MHPQIVTLSIGYVGMHCGLFRLQENVLISNYLLIKTNR